jgi:hypothetical protein
MPWGVRLLSIPATEFLATGVRCTSVLLNREFTVVVQTLGAAFSAPRMRELLSAAKRRHSDRSTRAGLMCATR